MAKPKPLFKAAFYAEQGRIIFENKDNKKKLQMFLEYYDLQHGTITIEMFSEVADHRRRYYWGLLLPAVTEKMGFKNVDYIHHIILKPRFLMEYVNSFDEIPNKVRNRARYVFDNAYNEDTGEVLYIAGTEIIQQKIVAYIPSTGDISDERYKQYLQEIEAFFYEELDGGFDEELNETLIELRGKCQL